MFPNTVVQTCIVHMIRNSARFVSYKDRKELVRDLKPVYAAANREGAEAALGSFEEKWARRYPMGAWPAGTGQRPRRAPSHGRGIDAFYPCIGRSEALVASGGPEGGRAQEAPAPRSAADLCSP